MKIARINLFTALFIALTSAAASKADLASFPICIWTGEQSAPAVSGHYVVWQDTRNSGRYNIYRNDPENLSNKDGIPIRINTTYNQVSPSIRDNIVVWQDSRYSTRPDILYCVLPSGLPAALINTTDQQESPVISDTNMVVWQEFVSDTNPDKNIYCYHFPSGPRTTVCALEDSMQENPAVSGNMVVWQDGRNVATGVDIYRYNLTTRQEFEVCRQSGDQKNPTISGKYVVWQDTRNGEPNSDIYGKDIDADREFVICSAGGAQINPAISGDIVVWEDYRSGQSNPHIYGYRISTQTEITICTQISYQKNPAIDGNFVVWQDFRNDASGDIYGAYIPAPAEPSKITVLDPNGGEMFLAGSQCTATWQTSGPPISRVKLECSTNNGQTFSVIDANAANTGSYTWNPLPVTDSNQCILKISDKNDATTSDVSDHTFTIFECDAALIADLNGDCKVDFGDFAAFNDQWLTCGNPYDSEWCP